MQIDQPIILQASVRESGLGTELTITNGFSFSLDDQAALKPNKDKILNFILQVVKKTLIEHEYK